MHGFTAARIGEPITYDQEELANEIRTINRSDPSNSEALIERYLEQRLKGVTPAERLALLEKLARKFEGVSPDEMKPGLRLESEEFSRLFTLLLGKRISVADLPSAELSEKLAQSLNTVFDTLNQITSVIHSTLLGQRAELETIRQIIGSQIEGEIGDNSLKNYLDQIQEAFLVAHRAFKQAAHIKVSEILSELDPDNIATSTDLGLKFGPLRKAELFDIYREKFQTCKRWFESGRLDEELLREFEKVCQKLYKMGTRRTQ